MQSKISSVVNGIRRVLARSEEQIGTTSAITSPSAPQPEATSTSTSPFTAPRARRPKRPPAVRSADPLGQAALAANAAPEESQAIVCDPIPVTNGVAVVYGYGAKVSIARGHLFLSDGIAADRRAGYLNRATSGLKHLVILGHTGSVTVDAFRWLHALGASVSMINSDGDVIFTSAPLGSDNAHLRRAQALAAYTDVGREITRSLLMAKVAGQARVLRQRGQDDVADHLGAAVDTLEGATTLEDMRLIEAHAADAYWGTWAALPVQFARKHTDKVPDHWKTFGQRTSGKNGTRQNATTPANALVNYLYAILETETRIALLTIGLDPGLGFLHSDTKSRDSLALDVMEVVRPNVDAWLLNLLKGRMFTQSDFAELPDGVCRITAKLARELCDTAPLWRALLGPVVEQIASSILAGHNPDAKLATNLTHTKRRAASAARRGQAIAPVNGARQTEQDVSIPSVSAVALLVSPPASIPRAKLVASCLECGKPLSGQQEKFCSRSCRTSHGREIKRKRYSASRAARSASQDTSGDQPENASRVPSKRKQAIADKASERVAWEITHPEINLTAERQRFSAELLPLLQAQDIPLRTISDGLGVSSGYASKIRRGEVVLHPMHYKSLEALIRGGH